jgi:phosphoserine phosphatase
MKNIYIVRHGETQWNKEEVFRGRKDIPLNEMGQKQAEMVGLYFRDKRIDRIVSSPLTRAVQTAEAISRTTSVAVESAEEFTDINFGAWEGLPLREVEERYPADLATWKTSPENFKIESGETLETVRKRISMWLAEVMSEKEGTFVVVTHRVICKLIVLYLLKIGNEHFWDMKYDPASITLMEQNNNQFTLAFGNDTCHLREGSPFSGYRDF